MKNKMSKTFEEIREKWDNADYAIQEMINNFEAIQDNLEELLSMDYPKEVKDEIEKCYYNIGAVLDEFEELDSIMCDADCSIQDCEYHPYLDEEDEE